MRRLSGRLRSALIIGGQGIRARKMRTLLSMISLFLGVLAVVVVQAGSETAQRSALANTELYWGVDGTLQMGVGGDAAVTTVAIDSLRGRTDAVAVTTTQAIIGEPNVRPVNEGGAPFDQPGGWGPRGGVAIQCDPTGYCYPVEIPGFQETPVGAAIEMQLVAMTGDVRQFRPYRHVSGEWLNFDEEPSYSPALVLNKEAAKGFGMYRVPAEMRITGASKNPTPRIIGVVDDGQTQPVAYVRMDELLNWMPITDSPVSVGDPFGFSSYGLDVLAAPTATESMHILRANLLAAGVSQDQLAVQTINSREQAERELVLLRVVFFGMAVLVLLIGVAGILNVGLATVGERIEEFALRRAVGTPRLLLAGIVLAETMITGLLTATAAIGVASFALQFAGPALAQAMSAPSLATMGFPWRAGLAGIIAGLAAGLLGGLVPAIRAARIPIASVMRA